MMVNELVSVAFVWREFGHVLAALLCAAHLGTVRGRCRTCTITSLLIQLLRVLRRIFVLDAERAA